MKHLGNHEISFLSTQTNVSEKIEIIDKLNIPIREAITFTPSYGDIFLRYSDLYILNDYITPIPLLNKNNTDVIKSVLVSEILFEDFLNFDNTDSDSYFSTHTFTEISAESTSSLVSFDSTVLDLNISDATLTLTNTNATDIHTALLEYQNDNIPLYIELSKDSTILVTTMLNRITTLILSDSTTIDLEGEILGSIDATDIININNLTISVINIDQTTTNKTRRILPHIHIESELDIPINELSGFIKTYNGVLDIGNPISINNISTCTYDSTGYGFDIAGKIENSNNLLLKNEYNNFGNSVDYTTTEVIIDATTTVYEYIFDSFVLDITNTERLYLDDKSYFEEDQTITVVDSTAYLVQYLAKYATFDNDSINITYEFIDQTSIDEFQTIGTDLKILLKYYEISVIQPTINNIPYLDIQETTVGYDINKTILLRKLSNLTNQTGSVNLTVKARAKFNFTFGDPALTIDIDEKFFDNTTTNITTLQESIIETITLNPGNYKLTPNNGTYTYGYIMV